MALETRIDLLTKVVFEIDRAKEANVSTLRNMQDGASHDRRVGVGKSCEISCFERSKQAQLDQTPRRFLEAKHSSGRGARSDPWSGACSAAKEHLVIHAIYKGIEIEMETHQHAHELWMCDYTLIKHPQRAMTIHRGTKTFPTLQSAREHALKDALSTIDQLIAFS